MVVLVKIHVLWEVSWSVFRRIVMVTSSVSSGPIISCLFVCFPGVTTLLVVFSQPGSGL
jgi:hypothetical protein